MNDSNEINQKFWNRVEYLPNNWNMLYLGGNNQFSNGSFEMISADKSIKITKKNYNSFDYELVKTKWTQSAYAIGYNENILVDFLRRLKLWREPIDVLQPILQRDNIYNTYVFLPTLIKPKAGFSDINGRYYDYNKNNANNF